ncbi:glycosyltransferase family 4 protein [Leptospira sp. B5-022]|uniref:glycosyltransferase family 4 protein n=1 Tax=Leptospira sp. B5-022 TaxID=1242992 RepID=UPI0002BEA0B3|nr:glycosyltransferase family 4 protein [Leptospira sp. B5-022]EMK00991.1 glycosyltransferase, group 1 family protein [Leptospira sp. B5-022]
MNILYLPGYRYPDSLKEPLTCGDLRYSFNLSRALVRLGHSVTVISRKESEDGESSELDGVHIFRYKSELRKIFSTSFDISINRFKLFRKLYKEADLIICNSPLSLELSLNIKKPIVYICSGLEDVKNYSFSLGEILGYLGIKLLRDPCKKKTWKIAKYVDTTAEKEDSTLLKWGIPAAKIKTIGPSVELSRYFPQSENLKDTFRKKLGLSDKQKVILSVSRFTPAKGLLETISAFKILSDKFSDLVLVLIGVRHSHNSSYYDKVISLIQDSGLKDKVKILENVPEAELPSYYSVADFVSVFSKDYDPLPTTIIESMACGAVVISTYYETREQMIRDKFNGIYVQERDTKDWADKIEWLLQNPSLPKEIRSHGIQVIQDRFDSLKVAKQYMDLMKS